jgi:hypothetical protein
LALPGDELNQSQHEKKKKLSAKASEQRWYALSVKDGVLIVEQVTDTTESDLLSVSGKNADRLLEGKPVKLPQKPTGLSLKPPAGTLLLVRIENNNGGSQSLTSGQYPSSVTPDVLREGWTASSEIGGIKWKFYTRHEKRSDGKLLAGSLEILADPEMPNGASMVLLPQASGMAFAKQELLWLGDLNNDGQPDLLLKRTWVTGEIDFVLVISPMLGSVYLDPDRPATYFSSGVSPEVNSFVWHKGQSKPEAINFVRQGSFSIGEDDWSSKLSHDALSLPIVLTDRQFKLNGETIRFTLEHLPRAEYQTKSSASRNIFWGGSVLVKVIFRGKTQVLMQAGQPDSGNFTLSVGLSGGKLSVMIDHQPHYNNGFTYYWIFDESESRFHRLRVAQSQGC